MIMRPEFFALRLMHRLASHGQESDCPLLQLTRFLMLGMLPTPFTVFSDRELFRCVHLVALGDVVKRPTLRALQPDDDSRSLLLSHRPPL